jgi:hypothetical protein
MKNKTTADLIILHTRQHLHLKTKCNKNKKNPLTFTKLGSLGIFLLAGTCVLIAAFQILNSSKKQTFIAQNSQDYVAQEIFYSKYKESIDQSIHSASPKTLKNSPIWSFLTLGSLILVILYLQKGPQFFKFNQPHFRIRKIR